MARSAPTYLTVKEVAAAFDRAVSTIEKYIKLKVLVVARIDPRTHVTRLLVRRHVDLRLKLCEYLHGPGYKVNMKETGRVLCEICGKSDEKLAKYLERDRPGRVLGKLERLADQAIRRRP